MYKQTKEFIYFGENVNHNPICPSRLSGANVTEGAASGSIPSNSTTNRDQPSTPLELKLRMLKAEASETMLYSCVTWNPRLCH